MSFFDDIGEPIEGAFVPPTDPLSGDQVLALRTKPTQVIPTGFSPIDNRLRGGGMPLGLTTCFTGPPESGKTRLECQIALNLSAAIPVVMLLTDWGRAAAVDIMTVMEGFDPARIDSDPAGAVAWWRSKIGRRPLFFLDDGATLVEAFDFADTLGHCAVLIDSMQTVPTAGVPGFDDARGFEKNRILSRYIKHRLRPIPNRPLPHTCIFTSESPRSFFAAKAKEDRSTEIAAALGGGLEYAADFMVAIHRPDGDSEQRSLIFAKNRFRPYSNPLPRTIIVDYQPDGRLFEVSPEEAERVESAARESAIAPFKTTLRSVLPQPSFRKFRQAAKAANPKLSDALFSTVLRVMADVDKTILEGDGPGRSITYSLAYQPPE